MTREDEERPSFVGLDWPSPPQGYKLLQSPPAGAFSSEPEQNSAAWPRLLSIFEKARQGSFGALALLPALVRSSGDFHLRVAALTLLGDAGSRELSLQIAEFFRDPDLDVRLAAYGAAAASANLDLARELVQHCSQLKRGMELDVVADAVSELIEREPDEFVEPTDPARFRRDACSRIDLLESRLGKGRPVRLGELVNLDELIEHIRWLAAVDGLSTRSLARFEAMTGILYGEWFDESGEIVTPEVLGTLDDFRASGAAERFEPGVRYFLGRRVEE